MTHPNRICLLLASLISAAVLTACDVLGGDEDPSPAPASVTATITGGPASSGALSVGDGATVIDTAFGTAVDAERKIVGGATSVFPPDTKRVYAVIVLENARPGDTVTGRWYKLDGASAPPDGALISEAGIELTDDTVGENAIARVALNLTASGDALAPGQWMVRVYLDEDLIRTMAFVVLAAPAAEASATPFPAAGPSASGTPAAEPPAPAATPESTATQEPAPSATTYTVVPGDTLTLIAERLKPANESTDSYVQRLMAANALTGQSILFVGQVLTLPPPQ